MKKLALIILTILVLVGCKKENITPLPPPPPDINTGYFIQETGGDSAHHICRWNKFKGLSEYGLPTGKLSTLLIHQQEKISILFVNVGDTVCFWVDADSLNPQRINIFAGEDTTKVQSFVFPTPNRFKVYYFETKDIVKELPLW